jgi:holo-[acyl-carrier protein] synthase
MTMIKGIGIDLVEVKRISQTLKKQGKRFLWRVFTPSEIKYCLEHKRAPNEHFAARFAAKEAFLKAIGTGWGSGDSPSWTEIEVVNLSNKTPQLRLKGKALWHIRKLKAKRIHLSLAHTVDYASAIAIIED